MATAPLRSSRDVLSGTAIVASLVGGAQASAQGVTAQFSVGGQVNTPRTFNLSDLQALTPIVTENANFLAGSSTTSATFMGIPFILINNVVGLKVNSGASQDQLRNVVIATGSDGFQQVYAWGKINPTFGGNAPAFNGAPVAGPELVAFANAPGQLLTSDGFARTTEPGDARGSRCVSNLQSIYVLHAPRMTGTFRRCVDSVHGHRIGRYALDLHGSIARGAPDGQEGHADHALRWIELVHGRSCLGHSSARGHHQQSQRQE
jgi:hypothetical protein